MSPVSLSEVRSAFADRLHRSGLDRAISVVVLWLLERNWLRYKVVHNPDASLYMLRVYLSPGGTAKDPHRFFAVFLHYLFAEDDPARGLHSHPYPWFVSLILTGGYNETRCQTEAETNDGSRWIASRDYAPGEFNVLTSHVYHRITKLHGEGVWSLFVCGPRYTHHPGWGFIDLEGSSYRDAEVEPITSHGFSR